MERVMGIEPTLAAWEAAVLPLNYTRYADPPRPVTNRSDRVAPSVARCPELYGRPDAAATRLSVFRGVPSRTQAAKCRPATRPRAALRLPGKRFRRRHAAAIAVAGPDSPPRACGDDRPRR